MVGEHTAWPPLTPVHYHTHGTSSLNLDDQPSPLLAVPTGSPHRSPGDTQSSLSPSLSRQQSKNSIRSLFSRGRSTSHTSQRPESASSRSRPTTRSSKTSVGSIARSESPHLSQMGSKLDAYRPTQATHAAHVDRARSERKQRGPSPCWDPPPLFLAYPQALKSATLDASCLSTEAILRRSSQASTNAADELVKEEPNQAMVNALMLNGFMDPPKKQTHAKKLSASLNMSGWTKHLFILVTSGYLLQYAGEGHHDRLPEKIMQLGKETVAFASDAIPGKHWVLQISQVAPKGEIVVPEPSKGMWSRLGRHSAAESRRTTQNFLMVFDNAGDLDSWLTTVRREVEALGGAQYRPQTPQDGGPAHAPERKPSHKLTSQKDPSTLSTSDSLLQNPVLSPVESEFPQDEIGRIQGRMLDFQFWDNEATAQQPSENASIITSTDLDRLRDSKDSSATTDTGTSASFLTRSSVSSPACDKFSLTALPTFEALDAAVILDAQKRGSLVFDSFSSKFLFDVLDTDDSEDAQAGAPTGMAGAKRISLGAPNFSVPISRDRYTALGPSFAHKPSSIPDTEVANVSVSLVGQSRVFLDLSIPSPVIETYSEEEVFSSRPISTIAPLPTRTALQSATGVRKNHARGPSLDDKQMQPEISPRSAKQHPASHNNSSAPERPPAMIPQRLSSLEQTTAILPAPFPPPTIGLPAMPKLPRSKSQQELNAPLGPKVAREPTSFLETRSHDSHGRPLSLSVFPEPPSNFHEGVGSPKDGALASSTPQDKPVRSSTHKVDLTKFPDPPSKVEQTAHQPVESNIGKDVLQQRSSDLTQDIPSISEHPSSHTPSIQSRRANTTHAAREQMKPLSLSRDVTRLPMFPEPPSGTQQPVQRLRGNSLTNPSQQNKAMSSLPPITALPQIPPSGLTPRTGVNARLAKIRDERCVSKLGLPPVGPPPSCPLPDTPSPRKRHFGKLYKQPSS